LKIISREIFFTSKRDFSQKYFLNINLHLASTPITLLLQTDRQT